MRRRRRGAATRLRYIPALLGALAALRPPIALAAPPPAVTVAPVAVRNIAPVYTFIGRVTAIHSVKLVPRVTAFIDAVPVRQGSEVKAGQVLFELQKGYQSQATLDQAIATRDQDQAAVLTAKANLAQAQLNLGYCTIAAPISGRIGTITLTKGNLVTPSTPALATINQLDPIRVVFSVSYRVIVEVERKTGATQGQIASGLTVNLKLPDGSEYKPAGRIAFNNNQVDPQTGTVSVYADFANPDRLLLPGAFVDVEVHRTKPLERPLVPAEALQTDRSGSFVLVVGPGNKIEARPVTLGPQIAQDFIVDKGLSGGERVVIAGVQKVKPGETVKPIPAVAAATAQAGSAPGEAARSGQGR